MPKLYESLLVQNNKDFEWLVVDDGSTDDTEILIQKYIKENKIHVRYYRQKNQGKHIAINWALNLAEGEYLITVDSDDYISSNCINICNSLAEKIDHKPNFAGFTFIRFSDKKPYDPAKYGNKEWTKPNSYQWEFRGEMTFIYKTNIAKQYPFPIYKNEKFCLETVHHISIQKKYSILFTDNILAHGDYLKDGLSQNMYKKILENPQYGMLAMRYKMKMAKNNEEKLFIAQNYWDIATKTGGGYIKNITKFPIYWTLKILISKLINKFKN